MYEVVLHLLILQLQSICPSSLFRGFIFSSRVHRRIAGNRRDFCVDHVSHDDTDVPFIASIKFIFKGGCVTIE